MTALIEVHRGSVQTWECDAMGHMNVRFYLSRAGDGLAALASELGAGRRHERRLGRGLSAVEHHVRFHGELRPGAPVVMRAGVLDVHPHGLRVYLELRNAAGEELGATFVAEARYLGLATHEAAALPDDVRMRANELRLSLPEQGRARGLSLDVPRASPTVKQADDLGLWQIYRGVVHAADCDTNGHLTPDGLMGRLSDGIPNLVAFLGGGDRSAAVHLGGAAVEYRLVYRSWPRVGDHLSVRSGLRGVGEKSLHLVHWIFDPESGKAVASAEAVSINLDLRTRRSMAHDAEARARLEGHVVAGLSL